MYKIQLEYIGGWDDAEWTEDGELMRFETEQEAWAEIDDYIEDIKEAVNRGDMDKDSLTTRKEFRVVKI